MRDLGYPRVNEIPADCSAITALVAARRSGKLYGGTTGRSAYLFVYDTAINKVRHLGVVPGQE